MKKTPVKKAIIEIEGIKNLVEIVDFDEIKENSLLIIRSKRQIDSFILSEFFKKTEKAIFIWMARESDSIEIADEAEMNKAGWFREGSEKDNKMIQWISLDEQKPEDEQKCLITDGEIVTAAIADMEFLEHSLNPGPWWGGCNFSGCEWEWEFDWEKITHWAPLPEPANDAVHRRAEAREKGQP